MDMLAVSQAIQGMGFRCHQVGNLASGGPNEYDVARGTISVESNQKVVLGRNDTTGITWKVIPTQVCTVSMLSLGGTKEFGVLTMIQSENESAVHVNGQKVSEETVLLRDGDVLSLYGLDFGYSVQVSAPSAVLPVASDEVSSSIITPVLSKNASSVTPTPAKSVSKSLVTVTSSLTYGGKKPAPEAATSLIHESAKRKGGSNKSPLSNKKAKKSPEMIDLCSPTKSDTNDVTRCYMKAVGSTCLNQRGVDNITGMFLSL